MACWEAFREDMWWHGLNEPLLTVHGNTGVCKAVGRKLPVSLVQRYQVHKRCHEEADLTGLARSYPEGLSAARAILASYEDYPARHLRSQWVIAPVRSPSLRPPKDGTG